MLTDPKIEIEAFYIICFSDQAIDTWRLFLRWQNLSGLFCCCCEELAKLFQFLLAVKKLTNCFNSYLRWGLSRLRVLFLKLSASSCKGTTRHCSETLVYYNCAWLVATTGSRSCLESWNWVEKFSFPSWSMRLKERYSWSLLKTRNWKKEILVSKVEIGFSLGTARQVELRRVWFICFLKLTTLLVSHMFTLDFPPMVFRVHLMLLVLHFGVARLHQPFRTHHCCDYSLFMD